MSAHEPRGHRPILRVASPRQRGAPVLSLTLAVTALSACAAPGDGTPAGSGAVDPLNAQRGIRGDRRPAGPAHRIRPSSTFTTACPGGVCDFTTGIPAGLTTDGNVEVSGGALVLKADAYGNYPSEGYVDIDVDVADVDGKLLRVDATRANMLAEPDFDATTTFWLYNPDPSCGSCGSITDTPQPGKWFSSGRWATSYPTLVSDGVGQYAEVYRSARALQFIHIRPGSNYDLSFDLDTTTLSDDQVFSVLTGYLTSSLDFASIFNPYTSETYAGSGTTPPALTLKQYSNEFGDNAAGFRIRTIDCDDHTEYTAGDGIYSSTVSFNFCEDSAGALDTVDYDSNVTGTYTEGDLEYMYLAFATSWGGSDSSYASYYVSLDNIVLDQEDQIEFAYLDSSDNEISASTLTSGHYLEDGTGVEKVRIYLRSDNDQVTPELRTFTVTDAFYLELAVGALKKDIRMPRLAAPSGVPPRSDFLDESLAEVRSECVDPNDGTTKNCYQAYADNNMIGMRAGADTSLLEATWDTTLNDYRFRLTTYGEFLFEDRYLTAESHGVALKDVILVPSLDAYFALNQADFEAMCPSGSAPENDCCYNSAGTERSWWDGITCPISYFPDLGGSGRTDTEQVYHLLASQAKFFANVLNATVYTKQDGTTMTMPKVKTFEIFGEPDRTPYAGSTVELDWATLTQAELWDLFNLIGYSVRSVRPDARMAIPAILGSEYASIDEDYISSSIADWNAGSFTDFNIHPYISESIAPEDLFDRWDSTKAILDANGWGGKNLVVTEWGYHHEKFDPACNYYDSSTGKYTYDSSQPTYWTRNWGIEEGSKLMARQAMTLLNLPAVNVHLYGMFTNETEYLGGDITQGDPDLTYPCWETVADPNFHIFDRVDGTGVLAGDYTDTDTTNDHDEPTQYQVNAAGTAFFTIAEHISNSAPHEVTLAVDSSNPLSDYEHYYATAQKVSPTVTYVGLWWYRDYLYGSGADYFNYVYGPKDDGWTEKRKHSIWIYGYYPNAELITLDGSDPPTLTVTTYAASTLIQGVTFGELPVLLKLY